MNHSVKIAESMKILVNAIKDEANEEKVWIAETKIRHLKAALAKIEQHLMMHAQEDDFADLPDAVLALVEERNVLKNTIRDDVDTIKAELRSVDDALGVDPKMIKRTRADRIKDLRASNKKLLGAVSESIEKMTAAREDAGKLRATENRLTSRRGVV